jgi:hypothetical protein
LGWLVGNTAWLLVWWWETDDDFSLLEKRRRKVSRFDKWNRRDVGIWKGIQGMEVTIPFLPLTGGRNCHQAKLKIWWISGWMSEREKGPFFSPLFFRKYFCVHHCSGQMILWPHVSPLLRMESRVEIKKRTRK